MKTALLACLLLSCSRVTPDAPLGARQQEKLVPVEIRRGDDARARAGFVESPRPATVYARPEDDPSYLPPAPGDKTVRFDSPRDHAAAKELGRLLPPRKAP